MAKPVKFVYVAAPYNSNPIHCTWQAMIYANQLVDLGLVPIVPHISTVLWNLHTPRPEAFWYQYVMELMRLCDAVVRFPGNSKGAEAEIVEAESRGIPVFYGLRDLIKYLDDTKKGMVQ
jgi:hypothetical protein